MHYLEVCCLVAEYLGIFEADLTDFSCNSLRAEHLLCVAQNMVCLAKCPSHVPLEGTCELLLSGGAPHTSGGSGQSVALSVSPVSMLMLCLLGL